MYQSEEDQQNTHESAGGQMDTGGASSSQKDSWEAYIKWLSTAEFGDDDDGSQSDSEEKDASEGDGASCRHSQHFNSSTRDQGSPNNLRVREGAGAARDGGAGRKRKSRWEPLPERGGDGPSTPKKRSRWSPEKPSAVQSHFRDVKKSILCTDPEFMDLKIKLVAINKKLRTGQVVDDKKPSRFRSPSPEPLYDNFGNRVNSRENRAREKLNQERQLILDRLAKKGPSFKSSFKHTKVYFPPSQYPEYNSLGLLLGPQGLQRVEKETGAILYIRGKSTGTAVSTHTKPAGDEKLHVRIEAESEITLNRAASMVRNLLFPVVGGQSKLKLLELVRPNVNPRANKECRHCKQLGHYRNECPERSRSFSVQKYLPTHPSGGTLEQGKKVHEVTACSNNALGSGLPGGMSGGELGIPAVQNPQQLCIDSALKEECNETHVYIGNLPLSINDAGLVRLFLRFGQVTHAKIIRDQGSGLSTGYGFVRFLKAADAGQAVSVMNGYRLDDKVLQVKLKVPLQVAANGSLSPSISQQGSQEELIVSSALHAFVPHAGMPLSRAAQVSAPSGALQGVGPCGGSLATSSGLEAHVGASRFLPPNHLVQQSQKQPSPSIATHSGSFLDYDYSPSQTQPFSSSATLGSVTGFYPPSSYDCFPPLKQPVSSSGVTGFYPPSSYDYCPPLKQPVSSSATEASASGLYHFSSATEAGACGFYRSSNVDILQSQTQPVPSSATEAGRDQHHSQKLSTPSNAPYASSAFPSAGVSTRNGTPLLPPNSFTLAANFFGQFMRAAAAAAAASSSRPPRNPDQQQLYKHSATAGAILDSRAAPPSVIGASNLFRGQPPPGRLEGRPRGHYSEQGGTTYHAHHGSRGQ